MDDKHEQNESAAEVDDSFEALLKQAAHVSGPAVASLGLQLRAGSTLLDGRLRIVRRIGEGGMGVVYEAFDERRRSSVALKTLNRLDATNVYRLKNEFRSLSEVSHAGLCRLHELFSEGGQWFFTMELIDGERFDKWVRPGGVCDEARLRGALPQLCEGIAAIHAAGKLHRDLKPSNVLVTQDGRVVVLDFGLAVDPELGGVGQTVLDESVSGTPAYMAPEQAAGVAATAASDFYAFGVMLFEALTGKLPFEGRVGEMLGAKQHRNAPSASAAVPDALSDLAALCDELLCREPMARPDPGGLRARLGEASHLGVPASAHAGAASARDLLLGRDAELAQLRSAYAATLAGQSVVLFVSGESGMGKSALVAHFLDELRAEGHAVVLAGRCYERESVPYKAFDAVVDELSRHLRKLSREDASALMPREVYALARLFPVLDRIDAVAQTPKKDIPDPQEMQQRAFAAFGELLGRIRDRRPLVVYIDDLQWADQDSTTFMRYLLAHSEPVPALLIASHRSEGAQDNALLQQTLHAAHKNPHIDTRTLAVECLSLSAVQALVRQLLGGAALEHAASIAAEAQGSPFFVGELVRQVRLAGTERGRFTLHDAVLRHVQGLGSGPRALLEVLAVAGRPLAVQLALDAASATHDALDVLLAERLLRVAGLGVERTLECYHDKIRESVAGALTPQALCTVHGRLVAVLQAQADVDPEHLALHLEGAGERRAAAEQMVKAGESAAATLAFERAASFYARALELGEFEPARARQLLVALGDAYTNAGRGAESADAYLKAADGAPRSQALDLKRLAAERLLMSGRVDRGAALLDEVLGALGMPVAKTHAGALAMFLWQRGLTRLRGFEFEEPPESGIDPNELLRLDASWSCAYGLAMTDNIRGAAYQAHHLRLALQAGEPRRVARAVALEYGFLGRFGPLTRKRADALYPQAQALAERVGDPATHGLLQCMHAVVTYCNGDFAAGVLAGEHALQTLQTVGLRAAYDEANTHFFFGLSLFFGGDLRRLSQLVPTWADAAARRNDVYAVVTLQNSWLNAAWLVLDQVNEAQQRMETARGLWTAATFQVQDLYALGGSTQLALYSGQDMEHAHRRIEDAWPKLQRSQLLGIPIIAWMMHSVRGQAAACTAREHTGSEARERLRIAEHSAQATSRSGLPMSPAFGASIRAAVACAQNNAERAARELRLAVTGLDAAGMRMYAAAHRRRLGALLGGDEGKRLVDEATAAMRAEAVVNPDRMTDLLAPGSALA